jgi:hypothetical protein
MMLKFGGLKVKDQTTLDEVRKLAKSKNLVISVSRDEYSIYRKVHGRVHFVSKTTSFESLVKQVNKL